MPADDLANSSLAAAVFDEGVLVDRHRAGCEEINAEKVDPESGDHAATSGMVDPRPGALAQMEPGITPDSFGNPPLTQRRYALGRPLQV